MVTPSRNPCCACGRTQTIGVAYADPEEVKFWCASCLPVEFKSVVTPRTNQEMFDAYGELEAARWLKVEKEEARLREEQSHD